MKHVWLARAYICIYTGTTLYTTWCEQRPSVLNKRIAVTRYIIILWKSPLQSYVIQLYVLAILFIYHCYFLTKSQNRRSATLVCVRGWKWRSANTWRWKIHWSSTILPQKTIPNLPTTFSYFLTMFLWCIFWQRSMCFLHWWNDRILYLCRKQMSVLTFRYLLLCSVGLMCPWRHKSFNVDRLINKYICSSGAIKQGFMGT